MEDLTKLNITVPPSVTVSETPHFWTACIEILHFCPGTRSLHVILLSFVFVVGRQLPQFKIVTL